MHRLGEEDAGNAAVGIAGGNGITVITVGNVGMSVGEGGVGNAAGRSQGNPFHGVGLRVGRQAPYVVTVSV